MCALVTGVQTCALPICLSQVQGVPRGARGCRLMARFDGKVVIVTGAGQGLGRAYAEVLAAEGASAIGRASGRERVWQYVSTSAVGESLKKKLQRTATRLSIRILRT